MALILTLFVANQFFLLLLASFMMNIVIHFWNKKNIYVYIDSFSQLRLLLKIVQELVKLNLTIPSDTVISSFKSIEKHKKAIAVFRFEQRSNADLISLVLGLLEGIRIFFLTEPLIAFGVLRNLDKKRQDMQVLFEYVGKIDTSISIGSLRERMPYYCIPSILHDTTLDFVNVYHPLIPNYIPNSLNTNHKSVLITGSNMSGKTTFIRTVAMNVLLVQTINTCFAESFTLSPMRLFSAIRISDDLLNDKSYYFEEVLTIKKMIAESRSSSTSLFLLDEIFKGTNTIERIAAGKAVLSYLGNSDNIVFVSTHDIELTELLTDTYALYHFTEIVENEQIKFDYQLKSGNLTTKNAIRILELNDYPDVVVTEVRKIAQILSGTA